MAADGLGASIEFATANHNDGPAAQSLPPIAPLASLASQQQRHQQPRATPGNGDYFIPLI